MSDVVKRTVVVIAAVAILGGVGLLAWQNHNDFERVMVAQAQAQLLLTAKSEAQSIESYIDNIYTELEILSSEFVTCRLIRDKSGKAVNPEYCTAMENSYRDVGKIVDVIYLLDAQGMVVNVSPFNEGVIDQDLSDMPGVKEVMESRRPFTSPLFVSLRKGMSLALVQPVFENGEFIGMLYALLPAQKINELVAHINQDKIRALLIDGNNRILSYPDAKYIGSGLNSIAGDGFFNQSIFKDVLQKASSDAQGTEGLFAFSPIHFGSNSWLLIVAADYSLIAGPMNKNSRNNLLMVGFVLLVFIFAGVILYRIQQKRAQLAISARALDIINKQLHLEIDERKRLEEELQKCAGVRRPIIG